MNSTLRIAKFTIMVITGVCGAFLNSCIVALNFRFWRDTTTSGAYKKILLAIGITNILFQGILIFDSICETFNFYFLCEHLLLSLLVFEFTLIKVNFWNTTWLSIFCCARLVNYNHQFFLRIKAKFISFLPHLIVGSVLVSATINSQLPWTTILHHYQNSTDYQHLSTPIIIFDHYYIIFCTLFGFIIPFSVTFVAIGLSVTTLVRHIKRIESGDSNLTSDQRRGHHRAVRTMVIRVLLDLLFFIVVVLAILDPILLNSSILYALWIQVLMYPTSQALLLILGNPKLKSAVCGLMNALL
ncbi:taste receptor type 2 member 41-like [Anomaloglossus baeobatrachus]|uniref:taste receptor type 2 member 41-like n=1 Tax=Anomaloglossus baeobatrachus TaxID=238106 RepID=UPI003F4FCC4D